VDTIDIDTVAVTSRNQFIETRGRRLAYRSIGTGKPVVWCTRLLLT
jgi:hypothetical protein